MAKKSGQRVHIGTETINGEKVPIYIGESRDKFTTTFKGAELFYDTLAGLIAAVKRRQRVKKAVISIPASYVVTPRHGYGDQKAEIVDIEITGKHERTSEILFRYVATGKSDKDRSWSSERMLRRMTPAEKKKYTELEQVHQKARTAFEDYRRKLAIHAGKLVDAEIAKAEKAED